METSLWYTHDRLFSSASFFVTQRRRELINLERTRQSWVWAIQPRCSATWHPCPPKQSVHGAWQWTLGGVSGCLGSFSYGTPTIPPSVAGVCDMKPINACMGHVKMVKPLHSQNYGKDLPSCSFPGVQQIPWHALTWFSSPLSPPWPPWPPWQTGSSWPHSWCPPLWPPPPGPPLSPELHHD